MRFERTIEEIKKSNAISEKQMCLLIRWSHSFSRNVRLRIAEVLGMVNPSIKGISILQRLLNDHDEVVAAEACDSLSYVGNEDCIKFLIEKLHSKSEIVRGYAATAIAMICSKENAESESAIEVISECCSTEKSAWVLQSFYYSLYLLGEEQMLDKLIAGYSKGDYYVKKATVEMLKDSISVDPSSIIILKKHIINSKDSSNEQTKKLMDILFSNRDGSTELQ